MDLALKADRSPRRSATASETASLFKRLNAPTTIDDRLMYDDAQGSHLRRGVEYLILPP
jgi:hypothetical protein